jgi:hypothetical protein
MDVKVVEKAVRVLNELLAREPAAMAKLFRFGAVVGDPGVGALVALREVRVTPRRSVAELGILGVLNGILADAPGQWPIGMLVDEQGKITGFRATPANIRKRHPWWVPDHSTKNYRCRAPRGRGPKKGQVKV